MKKWNYCMLLFPVLLMACNDGSGESNGKQIGLTDQSQQTQQAYADEQTTGGFSFTAHSAWTATVRETSTPRSSSSGVSWLRLLLGGEETYSGGSGTFTLTIEIDPNYTGSTRSATITIRSGSDSITITVTQEGLTEDGQVPQEPSPSGSYERYVSKMTCADLGVVNTTFTFEYDEQGRPTKMNTGFEELTFSYPNKNTIHAVETDGYSTYTNVVTLNSDGYAISIDRTNDDYDANYTYNNGFLSTYQSDQLTEQYTWQNGNLVTYTQYGSPQPDLAYTTHLNNDKVNVDFNLFFTEGIRDALGVFGWLGKRSKNYISSGTSWFARGTSIEDRGEYTLHWEFTCGLTAYAFDADGYVSSITIPGTVKQIKTIKATKAEEVVSEEQTSEVWSVTYAE